MIELDRHIEVLLLSNDCVVVPGFGGFMAHHIDARYDQSDGSFIPPIRTLGFNPQLKINDSLLIHSYIDAYELSYPDAQQRVEREVSELCEQLDEEGFYTLNNIGTLIKNDDGNLEFAPNEAGILTPDFYGLSAFSMRPLEASATIPQPYRDEQPAAEQKEDMPLLAIDESADDEENTINIRVSWIRNTVAVAAALLAFFLITTPVSNSVTTPVAFSTIQPAIHVDSAKADSSLQQSAQADSSQQHVEADTVQNAVSIPAAADIKGAADNIKAAADDIKAAADGIKAAADAKVEKTPAVSQPQAEPARQSYYVVVLASQVSMANARNFVERLHKTGYSEARIYTHNKVNRVVYGQYSNQAAAYKAVDRLRDNIEFEEAWVMEVK